MERNFRIPDVQLRKVPSELSGDIGFLLSTPQTMAVERASMAVFFLQFQLVSVLLIAEIQRKLLPGSLT